MYHYVHRYCYPMYVEIIFSININLISLVSFKICGNYSIIDILVHYNINITILSLAQAFILLYIITTQQNPLITCLNILNVQ